MLRSVKTVRNRPAWGSGSAITTSTVIWIYSKRTFSDDTNVLYENDGKANFEDVTSTAKLGAESRYISWGTAHC